MNMSAYGRMTASGKRKTHNYIQGKCINIKMKQYIVTGMTCAACAARVEKAVSKVEGVSSCSVSLLTNSMGVEGTASDEAVIAAVVGAGYKASAKKAEKGREQNTSADDALADRETPMLKKRLIASAIFLVILLYFSMGHMLWSWPLPGFLQGNHVAMGLLQLLLTAIIMVINQKFFISGFRALIHRSPNMDTLVAMGAAASFLYSTWALFAMSSAQVSGGSEAAMAYMDDFYFETAAMILTLITVGKTLEAHSKGKTTDALRSLMKLAPQTAVIEKDGTELTVPVGQVQKDDVFVVRPGESIPVDGVVIDGVSAVNEAALTGESIPVDKSTGDSVSAATINLSGFIRCRATRVGEDTALSKIIQMVSDAAATKAPIAKVADKVSGIFVPAVMTISLLTFIGWMLAGESVGGALSYAIAVLVISCPCALGLATPVAVMVGNGVGAKNGILFKTAASLEATGKIQIAALDKTGTITQGEPRVTDAVAIAAKDETELMELAYSLESKSEHPLAKAIVRRAEEMGLSAAEVTEFTALPGNGLSAVCGGQRLLGGSYRFISTQTVISDEVRLKSERLAEEGKTPLFFCRGGELAGIIAVADVIKEDSPRAIRELQDMGVHVVMLTGDNERTAKAIGRQAGVDEVVAGVLPDGKENVIRKLKEYGNVAMVGDGINDAPALTRADIGIAIGAGTDIAIDAADVVLMRSSLADVPAAVRLSRATLRNIHENLFWAFFYNAIGIPLAAGLFVGVLGWKLNPMFGAAAMSLSSFCVVTNALRLNLCRVHDARKDKKIRKQITSAIITDNGAEETEEGKEEKAMTRTLSVEGMMCSHCEGRVKKALEALEGVSAAEVSAQSGTAVVTLVSQVPDSALRAAVEAEGYPVKDIS